MSRANLQRDHAPTSGLVGRRLQRVEDRRFLTGRGSYVDDYQPPGLLYAAFLRAQEAHARIARVDTAAARGLPGVVAVMAGEEMSRRVKPMRAVSTMPGYKVVPTTALAVDKVRYVGEALAVVVAESRYAAEDALDRIVIETDPLEPVVDVEEALAPGATLLYDETGTNVIVTREFSRGDVTPGLSSAPGALAGSSSGSSEEVVVRERFRFHRHAAVAIEPRGCVAEYRAGVLTFHTATQCPGVVRTALAELLEIAESQIRVIAIDVGGGFGAKSSVYPEEVATAALACILERPIKWVSDRREDLLTTSQGWDEIIEAELTLSNDGKIAQLKAEAIADIGAYAVYPWTAAIEPVQTISFLPGPYRVPKYWARASAVATCKAPTGPYRGVGRPVSTFVMEGLMDRAARRLGIDPAELRLRNFIAESECPYKTPVGIVWDRADFSAELKKALEMLDYRDARSEQERARKDGRLIGIGVASYVELTGIGSATPAAPGMPLASGTEAATVRVDPSGTVTAIFGIASHGQGLETTLGQIVADEMGVALEQVRVLWGDTNVSPYGTGSYASRGAVLGGGAAMLAARAVMEKARRIASHLREAEPDQGAGPERHVTLADIARAAYAGKKRLPKDMEPGLEATRFYDPYYGTATSATHAAIVEVDPDTWSVRILKYVVAEDCGRLVNPLIVDGQVFGGVVQGLGGALLEEVVYEPGGQLVTASLMDYLLPTARDAPAITVHHIEAVSPSSIGGFRGVGESGTIGAPATVANAIADALAPLGIEVRELPITPAKIFAAASQKHRVWQVPLDHNAI